MTGETLWKFVACAAVMGFEAPSPVNAAEWPTKPVRIIVPYAAGGNTDLIARQSALILGEAFGKTFVADNRPGANGVIAAELTAKAAADGYTLMIAAAPPSS